MRAERLGRGMGKVSTTGILTIIELNNVVVVTLRPES